MPLSFDTRVVSVGELLSGTNIFRLPSFQRPYSWPEEKVAQLFDDLSSDYLQPSKQDGEDNASGYFLGAIIVARHGAARLNAEMTDPLCQPNFPHELTLEHVLPQRPSPQSVWLIKFPDPTKRRHLSELLGNYALLSQRMNPRGSNSEFSKKKKIYFDFRDHQNFAITAQLIEYEDWDEGVIVGRQKKLIGVASRVFSPHLAPFS
jgi:hypothetical protein